MEPTQGHALGFGVLTARHQSGDLQRHRPVWAPHAAADLLTIFENEGPARRARVATRRGCLALDDREVRVKDQGPRHEESILGQIGAT